MHMAMVIAGGVVLLGVFLLFGWLWGASAAGMALAAKVFVPVWLLVASLLHLMSHYELGNFEILDSLTKSVYRFMAKMQNLTVVEEEMFKFLRNSFLLSRNKLKAAFEVFLGKLKKLENDRFQTRSFAYLDIISWVESKVSEKPLGKVINEKYLARKKRHY